MSLLVTACGYNATEPKSEPHPVHKQTTQEVTFPDPASRECMTVLKQLSVPVNSQMAVIEQTIRHHGRRHPVHGVMAQKPHQVVWQVLGAHAVEVTNPALWAVMVGIHVPESVILR